MLRPRLALAAATALAAALALVPGASARHLIGPNWLTLDSAHFRITYDGAADQPDYLSQTQAGDVLGAAESAYSYYVSLGWPAPVLDSDGMLDIKVDTVTPPYVAIGHVTGPPTSGPAAGWFELDSVHGLASHTVAHMVFNLFEWAIDSSPDPWLDSGAAEWGAFGVDAFAGVNSNDFGEPDRTLDCVGDQCGYAPNATPDDLAYNRSGAPGWSFFEYLAERYGNGFIQTIFQTASANGLGSSSLTAVDDALASKGGSLSDAFNGWINTRLAGSFKLKALQGVLPQVFASSPTGATQGPLPRQIVTVDHLAARYLAFVPGDGTTSGLCHAGTLALSVTIPSGSSSKPAVFMQGMTSAQQLAISGNTASATIPWSDCTGGTPAYLSLPNASMTSNGANFTVNATLTIDLNTIATAVGPPAPINMPGVVMAAPVDPIAPTIQLWGPQIIHVSTTDRVLRLIVMSDTDGTIQGALGSYDLGTTAVRAGGNDLRFPLPVAALRLTAAIANPLAVSDVVTLRPLASTGFPGTDVTSTMAVDYSKTELAAWRALKNPKPKAKPKPKVKHPLKPPHRTADHKG
jgi:hypothetical protein